jgi:hypothetical protein
MARTILPETIREDIKSLLGKGYSKEAVHKFIQNAAQKYLSDNAQLMRCIVRIEQEVPNRPVKVIGFPAPPKSIKFDPIKYSIHTSNLTKSTSNKKIDEIGIKVAKNLLEKELGFTDVQDGPTFIGTPFDLIGLLKKKPYMIELKTSLVAFHHPGEIQKQRMQELLKNINGLHIALLQIKLKDAEYKIYYDNQLDPLFYGVKKTLSPIEGWLLKKLKGK